MPVSTHCKPNITLDTDELPVNNISVANSFIIDAAPGLVRGAVIYLHGMAVRRPAIPIPIIDQTGLLELNTLTFANGLAADGWVVIQPCYPEDNSTLLPSQAIFNDVDADTAHGARYLTNTLHWWDHVVNFVQAEYGTDFPIVPFGFSWGGWHAFQIAANKSDTILAYGSHIAATVVSDASPVFTSPVDFSATDTSGLDTTTGILDGVLQKPGIIGWGTNDSAVGYLEIQAIYNSALAAGCPVVSNPTNSNHELRSSDTTTYLNWFTNTVDPLAPKIF